MAGIKRANTSGITKTGTAIPDVPDAPTIGAVTDYNELLDAFIAPKCYPEATLDEVTCDWVCANTDHTVEVPE